MNKRKISSRAKKLVSLSEIAAAGAAGDFDVSNEARLARTIPDRLLLLADVANLRDNAAVARFWKIWAPRTIWPEENLIEIRDQLRAVWTNPESYKSECIVREWLNSKSPTGQPAFRSYIKVGGFVPDFSNLRAMLVQGIFENWKHFKFCANPSCETPYFIAKRTDQTICNGEICKQEKQRESARKWWKANRAKEGKNNVDL